MTSQVSPQANNEAWKLHGRDTPAGKALFALYGGDIGGKQAGTMFHQRNRHEHEKKLAKGWTPSPLEAPKPQYQRPQVAYPKFGGDKPENGSLASAARLKQMPRRRPGDVILREMKEDQQRAREALPPRSRGPVLDDAEKDRLAELMRYRGKVPAEYVTADEREAAARHRGVRKEALRSQRDELQMLFQETMQEIEERQAFLREMQSNGALKRNHVHQLQAEIKKRVEDMNRIDRMLRELDGE